MGAEFLPRELFALQVLDTKSKCNILGLSWAAATSPFPGIDMLNQLFHLINHIQILI